MMANIMIGAMILGMLAVAGVLGMGLVTMVRGKDVNGVKANKLMWMRVYLQAAVLVIFAIVMMIAKSHG